MPKRITPPITLPEYERLFRTLHAVALSERNDPAKDSLFFAVAGAYLLKRQGYKVVYGVRNSRKTDTSIT